MWVCPYCGSAVLAVIAASFGVKAFLAAVETRRHDLQMGTAE